MFTMAFGGVWEVKVLTSGVNTFHQEGLRSKKMNSRPRRLTPGITGALNT
jgi:hypothetical protein